MFDKFAIDNVRNDWRILDDADFPQIRSVRLLSHLAFASAPEIKVEFVAPTALTDLFKQIPILYWLLYALRLFHFADRSSVIIVDGSCTFLWIWCGIINRLLLTRKRRLLCWDVFVEYLLGTEKRLPFLPFFKLTTARKERFAKAILEQYGLNVVWSSKQVATHATHFGMERYQFIYLPFKANHSKTNASYNIPMDNFVFAGGNSKRDYRCLIDAVRGTGIPVIISATDPEVRNGVEQLPNVVVLAASEPAFAQLQAASRIVVIPLIPPGLRGGGEANFCNAMWHGKPVVAVDSIAAEDYIIEGVTGYLVPTGDSKTLRDRIMKLWNDEALCHEMGRKGREHVERNFTHAQFIRRLLRLGLLYGRESHYGYGSQ